VHHAPRREPANDREGIALADTSQLNLFGTVPRRREGGREPSIGYPTGVEGDQIVRPRGAQRKSAVVDRTAKASPRALRLAGWLRHRDLVFDPGDPSQMFSHQ
jgi:hypothetical protein